MDPIYKLNHLLNDKLSTSIYCPHRVINMFPKELSNNIISLLPNKNRLAITMWLTIEHNDVIAVKFEKTIINNTFPCPLPNKEPK